MNPIQRALSFLGSWRPGVCRRFEWGQVEKEGCWQALLGKVLNSTRLRLNICFPDFLQSSSQQKENIIYSDSKYEVTLHPFFSSAPTSSTQSTKAHHRHFPEPARTRHFSPLVPMQLLPACLLSTWSPWNSLHAQEPNLSF